MTGGVGSVGQNSHYPSTPVSHDPVCQLGRHREREAVMARSSREANKTKVSGYLIKTVSTFCFLDAADVKMLSDEVFFQMSSFCR